MLRWGPGTDTVESIYPAGRIPPPATQSVVDTPTIQPPQRNENVLVPGHTLGDPPTRTIVYLPSA